MTATRGVGPAAEKLSMRDEDHAYLTTFRRDGEDGDASAVYAADLAPEVRASLELRAGRAVSAFRLKRWLLFDALLVLTVLFAAMVCVVLSDPAGIVVLYGVPWIVIFASAAERRMRVRCPWCDASAFERVRPFCPSCGAHSRSDGTWPISCETCSAQYVRFPSRRGKRPLPFRPYRVRYCWCCGLWLDPNGF